MLFPCMLIKNLSRSMNLSAKAWLLFQEYISKQIRFRMKNASFIIAMTIFVNIHSVKSTLLKLLVIQYYTHEMIIFLWFYNFLSIQETENLAHESHGTHLAEEGMQKLKPFRTCILKIHCYRCHPNKRETQFCNSNGKVLFICQLKPKDIVG
jgi:hypothetical protein